MTISTRVPRLSRTFAALAAALTFGPALAQEGGGAPAFRAPENTISIGVSGASGNQSDRARWGMFNGLRDHDVNGLAGFNYTNNDASTAHWLTIQGNNLGLDSRDLGASYRWLGDLKVNVDYSELVRHDPRTINTSLQNAGTTNPIVPAGLIAPGAGQDLNLELKRKGLGLVVEKRFGDFQVEFNAKTEDKTGARFFGKGFACSTSWNQAFPAMGCGTNTSAYALLMLPEPVDSNIKQYDAKLNYLGQKLNLTAGYYGSFYTNNNGAIFPTIGLTAFGNQGGGTGSVPGTGNQGVNAGFAGLMSQPVALWPDNQSHQFYLSGNYAFTPSTKATFKYSYTHATQNESFTGMGLSAGPGGRDNFGGRLDWTKLQLGLAAHPLHDLHVHGDLAYDHKENNSPLDFYSQSYTCSTGNVVSRTCLAAGTSVPGAGNVNVRPNIPSAFWSNNVQSPTKYEAKIEATYRLPKDFLLVGGIKHEYEDYGAFTQTDVAGGISGLRQKFKNMSYRAELRKTMSESLTGSVSWITENKHGVSNWLVPANINNTNTTGVSAISEQAFFSRTNIIPFMFLNRQVDKYRLMVNWTPLERLSVQAFVEDGRTSWGGPTGDSGMQAMRLNTVSFDASYDLSENWKFTAYWSQAAQRSTLGSSTGYDARLNDRNTGSGFGFSGTPLANLRVGGDYTWIHDRLQYLQAADSSNAPSSVVVTYLNASGGLPDVKYQLSRLRLWGEYSFNKTSAVRADYIYNRTFFNEWTYNFNGTPWTYSDNTTLNAKQTQSVNYIGASYIYKFK
jgi:MtrB/PioB family decaheme-associated outer membrane protein